MCEEYLHVFTFIRKRLLIVLSVCFKSINPLRRSILQPGLCSSAVWFLSGPATYIGDSDLTALLSDLTYSVVAKFTTRMPQIKPKPSEIAAEAKRTYIPYIEQRMPQFPAKSFLHAETKSLSIDSNKTLEKRLRVAVIDGDPVDVALGWSDSNVRTSEQENQHSLGREAARIPLVSMANEKRAGGDWESGLMAPEECLCRRSNLVHALTTPWTSSAQSCHYPIPTKGGIYSPQVGGFNLLDRLLLRPG